MCDVKGAVIEFSSSHNTLKKSDYNENNFKLHADFDQFVIGRILGGAFSTFEKR